MQTDDTPIQITLDAQSSGLLANLAERDARPANDLAAALLRDALLQEEEDRYLAEISNQRIAASKDEETISHEDAWS